jgi:drug/metabolite transporter (DMT)-like permease
MGYSASLLSAAGYGAGQMLAGKIVTEYAPPMVATSFGLMLGTLFMLALSARHIPADLGTASRRDWAMVGLAGLSAAGGVAFLFLALDRAPVVVVAPIGGVYPLFVIVLSYLFLRRSERVTWQTVLGGVLVVGGVAAITVGTA